MELFANLQRPKGWGVCVGGGVEVTAQGLKNEAAKLRNLQ